jgi:hypothetical protein
MAFSVLIARGFSEFILNISERLIGRVRRVGQVGQVIKTKHGKTGPQMRHSGPRPGIQQAGRGE